MLWITQFQSPTDLLMNLYRKQAILSTDGGDPFPAVNAHFPTLSMQGGTQEILFVLLAFQSSWIFWLQTLDIIEVHTLNTFNVQKL